MLLKDKIAIITGGGRGIGRGITKRFAQEGAIVVIAQRGRERAEQTVQEVLDAGGTAAFVKTDISQRDQVEHLIAETVERFGTIDILVNNAGITGENGHFLEVSQETWDRIVRVNLTGQFMCGQEAARVMSEHGGGSIINITSTNGLVPQPRCCAYGSAKGGLEVLTRSMAVDLAPYNIRVNAIAPGPINQDDSPPRPTSITLLGRTGVPAEIGSVAVFLASDESSYITGERIAVDAGTLVNAYTIYGSKFRKPKDTP